MTKKIKVHPLQLFRFLRPFLFVLILPTLRRTVQFLLTGSFDRFLPAEVILTLWVLMTVFFKTKNFYINLEGKRLIITMGVFLKKVTLLSPPHIIWADIDINPIDAIFGTATIKIKTGAGLRPGADIILTLKRKNALIIMQGLGIK